MVSIRARAVRALIRLNVRNGRSLTLEERRVRIDRRASMAPLPAGTTVEPFEASGVRGEWVYAAGSRGDRVILYLHGGAFCVGSLRSHRGLIARVCAAAGACALSLDYRLAPEHPFPAALEDALAAYRHLAAGEPGHSRMALCGDSAGANIILSALVMLRDAGDPMPAAAVCISPPTDLTGSSASLRTRARLDPMITMEMVTPLLRAYALNADTADPRLSPLLADLHGLPPLLIHVGSREILHDDSLRFANKASHAGVDVRLEIGRGLWHVWHAAAPWVPEADAAIRRIGSFLREHIPDERTAP
jgi:acetyl esterase/lipase